MVGHVEWVQFARVAHVPCAGEVVHASDPFEEPAGGGAVAAVQLARLAGAALLVTALGDDEHGRRSVTRLGELGVDVRAAFGAGAEPPRGDAGGQAGERTITTFGAAAGTARGDGRRSGWSGLGGDRTRCTSRRATWRRCARARARARVLVASPRARERARPRRAARRAGAERRGRDRAARGGARAGRGRAGGLDRGRARRALSRAAASERPLGGRAAAGRARSTPTAAATRSRRGSPTAWARAWTCRTRSRWRRAAAPCA